MSDFLYHIILIPFAVSIGLVTLQYLWDWFLKKEKELLGIDDSEKIYTYKIEDCVIYLYSSISNKCLMFNKTDVLDIDFINGDKWNERVAVLVSNDFMEFNLGKVSRKQMYELSSFKVAK